MKAGITAHRPGFSIVDTLLLNAALMQKNSALESEIAETSARGLFHVLNRDLTRGGISAVPFSVPWFGQFLGTVQAFFCCQKLKTFLSVFGDFWCAMCDFS